MVKVRCSVVQWLPEVLSVWDQTPLVGLLDIILLYVQSWYKGPKKKKKITLPEILFLNFTFLGSVIEQMA